MKNILSIFLVVAIVLGLIPTGVSFAAETHMVTPIGVVEESNTPVDSVTWTIELSGIKSPVETFYRIKNNFSGLYLTKTSATLPSSVIEKEKVGDADWQFSATIATASNNIYQDWMFLEIVKDSATYYKIKSQSTNRFLTKVGDVNSDVGLRAELPNNDDSQLWSINRNQNVTNDYYVTNIRTKDGNLILSKLGDNFPLRLYETSYNPDYSWVCWYFNTQSPVVNGNVYKVMSWHGNYIQANYTFDDNNNQHWNLFDSGGLRYIWSYVGGGELTINADNTISCSASETDLARKRFQINNTTITDGAQFKIIDWYGNSIQSGTAKYTPEILALSSSTTPQMRWQFVKDTTHTNYYRIKNVASGLYLTRNDDASNGATGDKKGTVTEMNKISSYQQLWNIWTLYGVYNIWGVTDSYSDAYNGSSFGTQSLTISSGSVSWENSEMVGGNYAFEYTKVFNSFGQIYSNGAFGNGLVTKIAPMTDEGCLSSGKSISFSNVSAYSEIDASESRITMNGASDNRLGYIYNLYGLNLDYGIGYVNPGDTIAIPNVDFGNFGAAKATIQATAFDAGEKFGLYLDNDYVTKIGEFTIPNSNGTDLVRSAAQTVTIDIPSITGVHTVNIKWETAKASFFSIKFDKKLVDFGSYILTGTRITKINPKENLAVSDLLGTNKITFSGESSYIFKNGEETLAESGNVGTGTTLIVGGQTYTVLIYGDITGDGNISIYDLVKLKESLLKTNPLETGTIKAGAADVTKDGVISISDLIAVKKHILGISSIIQ